MCLSTGRSRSECLHIWRQVGLTTAAAPMICVGGAIVSEADQGRTLYAKAIQGVLPTLSNSTELPSTLANLAASDAHGITNGHGFYRYTEQESEEWEALYRDHAWTVRELMNKYFPLDES